METSTEQKKQTRATPRKRARAAGTEKDRERDRTQGQEERTQNRQSEGRTITIPLDPVINTAGKVVSLPVTAAQRILPAKGGLPLYAGLGALGVAGVLEWPVAAGIGVGYAVLRRGALKPPPSAKASQPAA